MKIFYLDQTFSENVWRADFKNSKNSILDCRFLFLWPFEVYLMKAIKGHLEAIFTVFIRQRWADSLTVVFSFDCTLSISQDVLKSAILLPKQSFVDSKTQPTVRIWGNGIELKNLVVLESVHQNCGIPEYYWGLLNITYRVLVKIAGLL